MNPTTTRLFTQQDLMLECYKLRLPYHVSFYEPPHILSVERLAKQWHLSAPYIKEYIAFCSRQTLAWQRFIDRVLTPVL